jgi:asparagine N-glycosylation enzyme membrane subunit Stt3
MVSVLYRVREWAADHSRAVQYPPGRVARQPRAPFFKHAMPFPRRVLYFVFGVVAIFISAAVLLFVGVFVWGILTQ